MFVISLSGGRSKNLIRVLRRLSWSSTLSSFLSLPKAMILQGQTWLSEISRKIFRKAEGDLACSAISDKSFVNLYFRKIRWKSPNCGHLGDKKVTLSSTQGPILFGSFTHGCAELRFFVLNWRILGLKKSDHFVLNWCVELRGSRIWKDGFVLIIRIRFYDLFILFETLWFN